MKNRNTSRQTLYTGESQKMSIKEGFVFFLSHIFISNIETFVYFGFIPHELLYVKPFLF